jgi:hypothetical protein
VIGPDNGTLWNANAGDADERHETRTLMTLMNADAAFSWAVATSPA